jgi:hypothetical protein
MAKADSVHSTPRLNTSATRRRFLSQSAGMAAGGAILALATIPPAAAVAAPTRPAAKSEAIYGLIEDHKAAFAAEDAAIRRYSELEEAIPEERRRGDTSAWEVIEVATDDPQWTAACHAYNDATLKVDQIAIEMLEAPISSYEGLAAVMGYAGEHIAAGNRWPCDLEGDGIAGREGCLYDWETALLVKAASTMRQLNAVAS